MTIIPDKASPIHVLSREIAEHVDESLAAAAARDAAAARALGAVETRRVTLPYEGGWMRLMAASVASLDVFGYKEFHLAAKADVRYAIHLFALADGRPLGIVDAALITTLRTAAAAALAAESFFGSAQSVRLGVVGTGAEALAGVRALAAALKLEHVRVTSRSETNRAKFVAALEDQLGLHAEATATVGDCGKGADLVFAATNSGGTVVVRPQDVDGVPFLASIGSTLPVQRELDGRVLAEARHVVVDTPDVLSESGDAIAAAQCGLDPDRVSLLGQMSSRAWGVAAGPTVYKSIGSPEQDIVLAHAVLEAARRSDFGRPMPPLSAIKVNM